MLVHYNYPGSQSHCAAYYSHGKKGHATAAAWWRTVHGKKGPCAPGGGGHLSDKSARAARYQDGTPVYHWLPVLDAGRELWYNLQTRQTCDQDPRG